MPGRWSRTSTLTKPAFIATAPAFASAAAI
jgi:hypothetical protein